MILHWLLNGWHWLVALYVITLYALAGWAMCQDGGE